MKQSPVVELQELANVIATRAASLVAFRRSQGVEVAATKSSPEDIVTFADQEAELFIREFLARDRPHDGFCGEESEAEAGSSGLTWVVDPIDGTVNYLYGIPHFSVSVGVVEGDAEPATWRPLAGAVVNAANKELFSAAAGGGATLNGKRIAVRQNQDLSQSLVATGFNYDVDLRGRQAQIVTHLVQHVRDIRRMGSAALDLCSIAAGRLDLFYERGLHPWDQAAGELIAAEAGAVITGLNGAPAGYDFLLAGNPGLVTQVEPLLAEWSREVGLLEP